MTTSELTDAESDIAPAPAPQPAKRTRRTPLRSRFRFGIQSKILITMLLSSILGVAVIGLIGAVSGRNALRQVESERLIELREGQKRAVQALFREVTNSLIVWSGGFTINEATAALTTGFAQLANATITPAQQQQLVNYYDNQMLKPIKHATGDSIDINAVLPNSNAQKYVQAYYTAAPRPTPDSLPVQDAGTAAHGRRPTPASISTSATSPPASTTATRCCSTRRATSSTAS
ncbi:adenylate and Guanylate cyclase catalytic domain protein [Mycobacterium avium subsp. avium 2285 (R)]|nr:adenylate and Guanylate cyclase catalytic domain protein [Mycobacterium avium subsp. avium 2285 (R)]